MHIERMHKAMEMLSSWFLCECEKGQTEFDLCAAGQVSDMLKDLAEASKECEEKKYFEELCCILKMEKEKMEKGESNDRMGYDHWRYPSSGRFASAGHGEFSGYPMTGKVHIHEPYLDGSMRMGYDSDRDWNQGMTNDRMGNSQNDRSNMRDNNGRMGYPMGAKDDYYPSKYGTGYDAYQMAKKHFTESKDEMSRRKMNDKIDETVLDSVEVLREMWRDATPDVRQRMKQQIEKLTKEMV